MNIIVINAAPRMETGNTQVILLPFVDGLRSTGAQVDLVFLNRLKIERCCGCFTCYAKTPGKCVHTDDIPELMERIRVSEALVLATPVYIDGMTALAKTFIDRLVTFMDPHFIEVDGEVRHPLRWEFPNKIFLVSVCGFPGVENFDPLLLYMKRMAKNFHATFAGTLLRPATFSVLMGRKYPDQVQAVLDAVRAAGVEFACDGGVSRSTIEAAAADICSMRELVDTANAYWDRELQKSKKSHL
ncbi:MAG: flavodoxin family protein [Desulfomonile sp.]|nr:flavodoxin family protein [Desulfomonile sp.]